MLRLDPSEGRWAEADPAKRPSFRPLAYVHLRRQDFGGQAFFLLTMESGREVKKANGVDPENLKNQIWRPTLKYARTTYDEDYTADAGQFKLNFVYITPKA